MAGLVRGSREWVQAMRAHHTHDEDIVLLCDMALELDDIVPDKQEEIQHGSERSERQDDEWSSGG